MVIPAFVYNGPGSLNKQQGKVAELRLELQSGGKKDKNHSAKKIALKKIVANMTMSNNDMVALFPDIVNCMNIPSLEIKKMSVQGLWSRGHGADDSAQVLPLLGQLRAHQTRSRAESAADHCECEHTWSLRRRTWD